MVKRVFDIVVSSALLLLLTPILVGVALLVYLQDRGPIFFYQERIGMGGEAFKIIKFRSMVVDAAKLGGYSTADLDPRITPIGRIIRRTSLDELPQLLNVVFGDMSLVGPRPDVPAQGVLYSPTDFAKRHSVRPGITGLAQATARSSGTHEERTRLDLQYVDKAGLLLDIKVLLLTARQVVLKGGN